MAIELDIGGGVVIAQDIGGHVVIELDIGGGVVIALDIGGQMVIITPNLSWSTCSFSSSIMFFLHQLQTSITHYHF